MNPEHQFAVSLEWQGNRGTGTSGYREYGRVHTVAAAGKHDISGSSARVFHGDHDRWNPEEMLISALSQCHLLSYLHVATHHGVIVTAYTDSAVGTLAVDRDGGGHFTSVTLRPRVTVASAEMAERAQTLHREAAAKCFIAASVNFPVGHETSVLVAG